MKNKSKFIQFVAITFSLLTLQASAAVVIEARLEAEEREEPFGYLFLEVGASDLSYSFWTSPKYESPGALRIAGTDATWSLPLGEAQTVRIDADQYGNIRLPENPFVKKPIFDGEPEWVPIDKTDIPDVKNIRMPPALTLWAEYSGKIENEEFASFLTGETGLLATMGALYIQRIEGAIVFSSFTLAEGELIRTSDLTTITAIPEPATTVLIAGGLIFLLGVSFRSIRGRSAEL